MSAIILIIYNKKENRIQSFDFVRHRESDNDQVQREDDQLRRQVPPVHHDETRESPLRPGDIH